MSVESIIERIPEPRAVEDLVAAARGLDQLVDSLLVLLMRVKRSNYDPGPILIADIDAALHEHWRG